MGGSVLAILVYLFIDFTIFIKNRIFEKINIPAPRYMNIPDKKNAKRKKIPMMKCIYKTVILYYLQQLILS